MTRTLIALAFLALATPAFASGTTVVNKSGLPIDELFASPPGAAQWSKNLMEGMAEGALEHGMTADVSELADGTYDLKISAPDEAVLCVIHNVEVREHKIELLEDHGKACK